MKTKRKVICAVALLFVAASAAPARAQETWDETLKSTISSWWSSAKNTARVMSLSSVTVNMCWASDKSAFASDPAVLAGFNKIAGNEKVTVTFPHDNSGALLGSGDLMNDWESGKLDCATVSPDASILGLRSAKWNAAEQVVYASSMVVAVVNPEPAAILAKYYKKDAKALTFADLVNVAGKKWSELDPDNAQIANWGTVKGFATDCARSASCQVAAVEIAYSAIGDATPTGREMSDPKVKSVIDAYRNAVEHSEASTTRLTQKCFLNPVECDFFFTYESKLADIAKQIPGAVILYNDKVIPADQAALVTTSDPAHREAAIRFLDYVMSPPVQQLLAEKYGFRPGTVVDIQGPVQKLKMMRLGIVHNPNPILVKSVLASVTAPAGQ